MKTALTILTVTLIVGLTLTGCNSVYVTSAKVYLQQNDLDKAKEQLLMGLDENPNDAQAHYLLGDIYAQQKNYPEMLNEFNTSLALSPKHKAEIETTKGKVFKDLYNQAVEQFNKQQHEEAGKTLQMAVTVKPEDRSGWSLLSKAYINGKKYTEAIDALNKVVALDPKAEAMEDRGWLMKMYYATEQFDKAREVAQDILSRDPSNKEAVSNLANSFSEMAKRENDPQKKKALQQNALDYYNKEIANRPNDADLHYNLGVLYQTLENFDSAQREFQQAFELNPQDKDAILSSTAIFIIKSEKDSANAMTYYRSAVEGYKKYLELDPSSDKIWLAMGSLQIQIGSILENRAIAMEERKNVTAAQKTEIKAMKTEAKGWVDDGKKSLSPKVVKKSDVISANYDQTWSALVSTLAENQLPIKVVEKESGLIGTDFVSFKGDVKDYAYHPSNLLGSWVSGRYSLNIQVTKLTPDSTRVTINSHIEGWETETKNWYVCDSNGTLEADIFSKIKARGSK
jgi:tetratricopeptide (TPR) repeat protein